MGMKPLRDVGGRWSAAPILTLLCLATMWGVAGSAGSQELATGTPGVSIIAQNGFGNPNNSFAWSMSWFKGKLYVGTGRDEACVELETSSFYFPQSGAYNANPQPNVHCPADPYNMSLQAEIWQYTPPSTPTGTTTTISTTTTTGSTKATKTTTTVPSGGTWKRVYQAPLENNPLANGKQVSRDLAYRGMTSMKDPQGNRALFAAAVTPDEYIPPLLKSHPPVILRSFDGVHWQTLHLPYVTVHYPNGNNAPMGFRSLVVWRDHLFVTATPDITGDGALFEVTNQWSNHPGLRQVSGPEYDIFEVDTFDGGLYIGTGNREVGYGVYRTFGMTNSGYFNFHQVVGDGAGRGYVITSVVSMHPYKGGLYVGASGWYNQNTIPASEMIRIAPNGQWTLVVGDPRTLPDGQTMYPTSGLYDGFFSPFAAHFWRQAVQGGGLYVGTNDWAYLVQEDKQYAWLQETALAGVLGFNIWATCDGNDWFNVTRDAFDGDEYNFGGRSIVNGGNHDQDLFIGSANQAQGTTIFDDQEEACSSLVGKSSRSVSDATAVAPTDLMTDSLKHGTLLTWDRSANASSYEIERASFSNITLGLKAPRTLPNGWWMEDATPTVTSPNAPGAVTVSLSVPGAFEPVGTTDSSDFVDPKSGKYVYEVVAKSATGKRSSPSNVEVVPSAGAPATLSALRSALGIGVVSNAARLKSNAKVGVTTTSASPRLARLLEAAGTAVAHGDDAAARRDVAAVQAAAGDNAAVAAVAARVVRRLEYARIAGQP
jgi:hypothetical protein